MRKRSLENSDFKFGIINAIDKQEDNTTGKQSMNSSPPVTIDSIEYLLQLSQQVDKNTNTTTSASQPLVLSQAPLQSPSPSPLPVQKPIQAPISNIDSLLIKFPREVNISNLMNTYLDHELRLICSFKKIRFLSTLRKYEICEKVLQLFARGILQQDFTRLNIHIPSQLQQQQQQEVKHMYLQGNTTKSSQMQNIPITSTSTGSLNNNHNTNNDNNRPVTDSVADSFYDVKNKGVLSTLNHLMEMENDKAASTDNTGRSNTSSSSDGCMIEEKQSYIDTGVCTASSWTNTSPKTAALLDKELFYSNLGFSNLFKERKNNNNNNDNNNNNNKSNESQLEKNTNNESENSDDKKIEMKNEAFYSLGVREHLYPEIHGHEGHEEGYDSLIVARFDKRELGLQFTKKVGSDGHEVAVVSVPTTNTNTNVRNLNYGSKLVAINHGRTKGLSFDEQCRLIKALPRPVILTFIN